MAAIIRARRTLPGIAFRSEVPAHVVLPRMDIVGFVGIAASGPLHIPVAIEDIAQFEAIFGELQPLAWDAEAGHWITNQLAPAVRDFFAQGGKRCWVVRVGHLAESNHFPVGGLLARDGVGYRAPIVQARSPGSWSDPLRIGATALAQALNSATESLPTDDTLTLIVQSLQGAPLGVGDLFKLEFRQPPPNDNLADRRLAFVHVTDIGPAPTPFGRVGQWQSIVGNALWFTEIDIETTHDGSVTWLSADGTSVPIPLFNRLERDALGRLSLIFHDTTEVDMNDQRKEAITLPRVTASDLQQIQTGDWLALNQGTGSVLMQVGQILRLPAADADSVLIEVHIADAWEVGALPEPTLPLRRVTRLKLALRAQQGAEITHTLSELSYAKGHARFLGYLTTDDEYYHEPQGFPQPGQVHIAKELRDESAATRFPFAAVAGGEELVYIPLGLQTAPDLWRPPHPESDSATARIRDGLVPEHADPFAITPSQWGAHLEAMFLDPSLRFSGQGSLLLDAFERRFEQGTDLRGLHSLLPVEEVSAVALPDLTQLGWLLTYAATESEEPKPVEVVEPCVHDDYLFAPKPIQVPAEESDAVTSPRVTLKPPFQPLWSVMRSEYPTDTMLLVHTKAVELCAARADMVAILSVPHRSTARDVTEYQGELLGNLRISSEKASTYAALYYPSIFSRNADGIVRPTAPDGAVCGVLASRSRRRGAWVAPANDPLRHAVSLVPHVPASALDDLYQNGVNVLRQDPRGFTVWGVHTLSDDEEWRALNVRRLMILLRRIALRDGQRYAFDVQNGPFRRRVRQGMEAILATLFERGAFAGSNPAEAYRVVMDDTLNNRASIEQGRFIVELRVAPSQPLVFMKVRLIESGGTAIVVEG